ncbi:hypothetical protein [Streptosporangium sp. NPDC051022]|uniref:hypothetical protein n=1 Tax=Streptosporangium sp. NPDC051022 TaxID=3155752 RepID=UPI0034318ABA
MILQRRPPSVDPGLLAERLLALRRAHPGWNISYDSGIRVWRAFRRRIPEAGEARAGIRYMVRTATPERMDEKLTEQAEILNALPPLPPPAPPRTFLRF